MFWIAPGNSERQASDVMSQQSPSWPWPMSAGSILPEKSRMCSPSPSLQISLPRFHSISASTSLAFFSFHAPMDVASGGKSPSSNWKQQHGGCAWREQRQLHQQQSFSPTASQVLPHAPSAYDAKHGTT